MDNMATASVPQYYAGKKVFVTGATGFMGKVLVEKLLRSCPDIGVIYILLRPKKGQASKERLEDFVNCQIFDKIRDENPENLKKVRLVAGDILKPELGLSDHDRNELQKECQIIFHCAACVRFDQKLRDAVNMNTAGTQGVLELAENMEKLEVFLHVSTAYSQCHLDVLEEKVYPAPHKPRHVIDTVNWMEDDLLEHLTPKMIAPQPNTYAYTKSLTEDLVASYSHKFPIVIARPSIVTAAFKEPMPGWVENLNGPTGLLVGAGKGVIRTMHCEESYKADILPVDMAVNGCILLAYTTAIDKPNDLRVCNITESGINPVTWGEALEMGRFHLKEYPFSMCLWYPGGSIKSSKIVHQIAHFFTHLLPAYFIDLLMFLLGKKPFMVKVQQRISSGLDVLQYYTTKEWQFKNDNFLALRQRVSQEDSETFFTDMRVIDWSSYIRDYIIGAREYCCKEDPASIPGARKLQQKLYYLDKATQIVIYALFSWLILSQVHIFYWVVEFFSSLTSRLSPLSRVLAEEI